MRVYIAASRRPRWTVGNQTQGAGRDSMAARHVFFSIPLAAKRDEAGWEIACRLLSHTLGSILGQTDPEFEVVIMGHEQPSIAELDDPRVTFLRAPFASPRDPSEYMRDKARKKRHNARHIRARGGGYILFMDADDLVSRHLVKHISATGHPHGYIFKRGYVLDYQSGAIAPLPGPRMAGFDQFCGSCAAIHFSPADIGATDTDHGSSFYGQFRNHREWEDAAARAGRPLQPVPFPAAIYVLNTSQNLSAAGQNGRQRLRRRIANLHHWQIRLTPEIVTDFSLAPVLASTSRLARVRATIHGLALAQAYRWRSRPGQPVKERAG